jgi:effector-binding domain-containing protein
MYAKLYRELKRLGISATGPEVTFYYNEEYTETDLDMEVGIIIQGSSAEIEKIKSSEITYKKTTPKDKVASLIYSGPFDGMEIAVIELIKWIGTNNWEITGELTEIHHSGPSHIDGQTQKHNVVELQIPIKKEK